MIYHFFSAKYLHLSPQIIESIIDYSNVTNKNGIDDIYIIIENTGKAIFKDQSQENIYREIANNKNFKNFKIINNKWIWLKKIFSIKKKDKIFFHSSQSMFLTTMLNFIIYTFSLKKKANTINYICWGSDYGFCTNLNKIDSYIKKFIAHIYETVWPWYGNIITLTLDDETKVKTAYHTNNVKTIPYMSNRTVSQIPEKSKPIKIMVSHSGWTHNNHLESFKLLERFKDEDIEIICPLCYGDPIYIDEIIKTGKRIFGDKFTYFTELMSIDDYIDLVHKNHIYISAADVQTGLGAAHINIDGNVKVFLKGNSYNAITNEGYKIFPFNSLSYISFDKLIEPLNSENLKNIKQIKKETLNNTLLKWKEVYE